MQGLGAELLSEFKRIVECPYPASLTNLSCLLERADALVIRACIHNLSSCAVSRLAALVSEALPLWAYTLHILSSLCQSVEFTNTIVTQNPGLLHTLLTKANSSEPDFDEHVALCVLLLSNPLPDAVPLPASAQSFFFRVFEKAIKEPVLGSLKSVYYMLDGACRQLLSLLPAESRQSFDEELCKLLFSSGSGQDFTLLLWCFGIVLLAEHPHDTGLGQHSGDKQWTTNAGRALFGSPSRKAKTINLTYLSVIWVTKGNVGISDKDAIEAIHTAIRTLQFVDPNIREAWPTSSGLASNTFLKLPSKISRADIKPCVQLRALSFYALIAGRGRLPPELVAQYQQCLSNVSEMIDTEGLEETLVASLPLYCSQLRENFIQSLFGEILDACISPPLEHQLFNYTIVVRSIKSVVAGCADAQAKFLSAISSDTIQVKVEQLLQLSIDDPAGTCCSSSVLLQGQMISVTIAMLLTLAVTTQAHTPALPTTLTTSLIDKQRLLPSFKNQCFHAPFVSQYTAVSLFQQHSTPYTGQHLQDWRGRLRSELESQSFYQRDSVLRSVAQICQELESRCNTAEEPLRRETEKSQNMERQIKQLNEEISFLKSQAADCRFQLDGLEDERDGLATRLEELQIQYNESRDQAKKSLQAAREEAKVTEAGLQSVIISREKGLRVCNETIEEKDSTISRLQKDFAELHDHNLLLERKRGELQLLVEEAEQQLAIERQSGRAQSDKIAPLSGRIDQLETELSNAESGLETMKTQLEESRAKHQESILSSTEAYSALEIKCQQEVEAVTNAAEVDKKKLQDRVEKLIQTNRQTNSAYETTRGDLQSLQDSIPTFEAKLQELNDLCLRQETELNEFKGWRKNVLASMGVGAQQPLAIRLASGPQKDAVVTHSVRKPREHRRHKSAVHIQDNIPNTPEGIYDTTNLAMEDITNSSFVSSGSNTSQNGSSPKRPRHQLPSTVPSLQTSYIQKPIQTFRSASKRALPNGRMALQQMSPNRRHTMDGFTAELDKEDRHKQELDEFSNFALGDSETLTPLTPGNFISGTDRLFEEVDDGSTTEF